MAACGAMSLQDRGLLADLRCRWRMLVAGCSKMVDGRAVISAPRPGSPIQWAACKCRLVATRPASPPAPSAACCRCRSTTQARRRRRPARDDPVQGHRPEDRLTGHQPGWPGRVRRRGRRLDGRDAAAVGARAVRSRRLRPARGGATPRPRCGATPTPTTTGCGPTPTWTTRRRVSPTSRRRPRSSSSAASTRWARSSWPTSEPRTWPRISTRCAPPSATRS